MHVHRVTLVGIGNSLFSVCALAWIGLLTGKDRLWVWSKISMDLKLLFFGINPFTAMVSHAKMTNKSVKSETVFVFFFVHRHQCERIFIRTHSFESRCIMGPENVLFEGVSVHLSTWKFYKLGSEGVKLSLGVIFLSTPPPPPPPPHLSTPLPPSPFL